MSLIINDEIEKASANEVKSYTGFSIGGVPPIAHKHSPTRTFIDSNLNRFDQVYAAAGHPYVVFGITFKQLCNFTDAKVSNIVN